MSNVNTKILDQNGIKTLWELVKERDSKRDNYFNYKDDFVPYNGQICFVDTARDGLQVKVGDGVTPWSELNYIIASDTTAGLLKLYQSTGSNTDGTMSQQAITSELETKFSVEVDSSDTELIHFYINK
jgi:hypothetical protein